MRCKKDKRNEVISIVCRECGCECHIEVDPQEREAWFQLKYPECDYARNLAGNYIVDEPDYPEDWNC